MTSRREDAEDAWRRVFASISGYNRVTANFGNSTIMDELAKLECTQRIRHCSTKKRLARCGVRLSGFDGSLGDLAWVITNPEGGVSVRKAEEPSEELE